MQKKEWITVPSRWDGLELSVLITEPEGRKLPLRGVIQLFHGMSEYKERYLPLMEYFTRRGFACVIHDHRGHGKSLYRMEDQGYMYGAGAEGFLQDMRLVYDCARERFPDVPVIVFGHSMGSLAARCFVKDYDHLVDALVLSGSPSRNPALGAAIALAKVQQKRYGGRHKGKLLEMFTFGGYAAQFRESRCAWVCADSQVAREYESHPMCGFTFTIDGYLTLFELMRRTYDLQSWGLSNPDLPILFLGGEDDPCIGGIRRFEDAMTCLKRVGYRDITGRLYRGMRHEICNEAGKKQVFQDIEQFLVEKGI